MNPQDLEFEKLVISETICLALHGLDLVVRTLQGSRADWIVVVGQEASSMLVQCLGHLPEHVDTRCLGPSYPVVEEQCGVSLPGLLPELPEVFLHVVGQCQGLVQ